jgi:hypothetical protein
MRERAGGVLRAGLFSFGFPIFRSHPVLGCGRRDIPELSYHNVIHTLGSEFRMTGSPEAIGSSVGLVSINAHGALHFPTQLTLELWRYADLSLLIE